MVHAQIVADLETAMLAVSAALASGKVTVSYTIRGRQHTVKPSDEVLDNLEKLHARFSRKASKRGRWTVASLGRTSHTGHG